MVSSQSKEKIKLFPFIRLIDIEENSGLEAFYFYSKLCKGEGKGSENTSGELLYISHQQINHQNQFYNDSRISSIFL